jgi:hypothetical protein
MVSIRQTIFPMLHFIAICRPALTYGNYPVWIVRGRVIGRGHGLAVDGSQQSWQNG